MVYTVYKHTFPNNKVYIGITCQKPERRWRKDGSGYGKIRNGKFGQRLVWRAIQKYGWENVKHDILNEVEIKEEAERLERYYITEVYHSNEVDKGYNVDNGGNHVGKLSEETKEKLRKANLGKKMSPENVEKLRLRLLGHETSEETKQKLSEKQKNRKMYNNGEINKWFRIDEVIPEGWELGLLKTHKFGMTGKKFYNNGLINITLNSDDPVPEGFIEGIVDKERRKEQMRINIKGKRRYNNGIVTILVKDGDPIPEGFVKGMLKKHGGEE